MPKIMNMLPNLKPYVINKAEDGKTAKVNLYGEIVEDVPVDFWTGEKISGLFIELKSFLSDVEDLSGMDEVFFYINSVGGSVDAGISIFNKIRAMEAETTTVVDGLAASAASIVAQAGDHRQVSLGSQTMVHCASAGLCGYYNNQDLSDVSKMLESEDKRIAQILADRTGRSEKDMLKMMKATSWMTADEAVEEGFADEVVGKSEPVVDRITNTATYVVNGIPHNLTNLQAPTFKAVGEFVPKAKISNGTEPRDIDNPSKSNKEEKSMDINTLKAEYPELVEQIENEARQTAQSENTQAVENAVSEAVKAERKRLQDIDSIAKTLSADLVNEAKYGEAPISASELALKALQEQQAKGASFLESRNQEQKDADVNGVVPQPVAGTEEDSLTKDIEDGAKLLNAALTK